MIARDEGMTKIKLFHIFSIAGLSMCLSVFATNTVNATHEEDVVKGHHPALPQPITPDLSNLFEQQERLSLKFTRLSDQQTLWNAKWNQYLADCASFNIEIVQFNSTLHVIGYEQNKTREDLAQRRNLLKITGGFLNNQKTHLAAEKKNLANESFLLNEMHKSYLAGLGED